MRLPIICILVLLSAIRIHAADGPQEPQPAEWPTFAALMANAKPKQYLSFQGTIRANGQEQKLHTYYWWDPADTEPQLTQLMTQVADAPKQPPTDGKPPQVVIQKPKLDPNAPFQKNPVPPGPTLDRETVTSRAFAHMAIAGQVYAGTVYEHDIRMTMPDGKPLTITTTMWVSPAAPLLGIIKVQQIILGPTQMTSTMELFWSSAHDDLPAPAEPAAPEVPAVTAASAEQYLALSRAAAAQAWNLDDVSKISYDDLSIAQSYRLSLGLYYLDTGRVDEARAVYETLKTSSTFGPPLRDRFRTIAALAKDREALKTLDIRENQLDWQMAWLRFDHMKTHWLEYPSETVLAEIQAIPTEKDRLNIAHHAILSDIAFTGSELHALLAMFPPEKQLEIVRDAARNLVSSGNTTRFIRNAEAVPAYRQDPTYWPYRLQLTAKDPEESVVPTQVDAMLQHPDLNAALVAETLSLLKDPRAPEYRRQAAIAKEKSARETAVKAQQEKRLTADLVIRLAEAVAATGDHHGSRELIRTTLKDPRTRDQYAAIIALYGSGKKAEALAWRDDPFLNQWEKDNQPEIWKQTAIAETSLGFARWELTYGDRQAALAHIQTAGKAALAANKLLVAHNAALPKGQDKIYWQKDLSYGNSTAPHTLVVKSLIEAGEYQIALRMAMEVQDEMPAHSGTRDTWQALQDGLAKAGEWQFFAASMIAMPKQLERNWHRNRLAIGGQQLGENNQLAIIEEAGDALEDAADRSYFLRATVIGAATKGHQETALACMDRLSAAIEAGGSKSDANFGYVAVAYGYLLADDPQTALEWYSRRSGSIREYRPRWEFNGAAATGFLRDMGKELATLTTDPAVINSWLALFKSKDELAYFTLGLATPTP